MVVVVLHIKDQLMKICMGLMEGQNYFGMTVDFLEKVIDFQTLSRYFKYHQILNKEPARFGGFSGFTKARPRYTKGKARVGGRVSKNHLMVSHPESLTVPCTGTVTLWF